MPKEMQNFQLGTPALVCRWRLSNAALPLASRHLRALSQRYLKGERLSAQMLAWVKQELEWALKEGAALNPNGTLMLVVDEEGKAALSVGSYEELPSNKLIALIARARLSEREAEQTCVAPESLIAWQDNTLFWDEGAERVSSGALTFVLDLARQMGLQCRGQEQLLDAIDRRRDAHLGVALVSDEHGVVCAQEFACDALTRFEDSYKLLLEKTHA